MTSLPEKQKANNTHLDKEIKYIYFGLILKIWYSSHITDPKDLTIINSINRKRIQSLKLCWGHYKNQSMQTLHIEANLISIC